MLILNEKWRRRRPFSDLEAVDQTELESWTEIPTVRIIKVRV